MKLSKSIDIAFSGKDSLIQHTSPRLLLWDLTVIVAQERSIDELAKVHCHTTGASDWMGSDTDNFLFDKYDLSLAYVSVKLPEQPINKDISIDRDFFNAMNSFQGSFHLNELVGPFYVAQTNYRIHDVAASVLGGVYFDNICYLSSVVKYQLAPDFYLLFSNDIYVGWILCNPEKYLVSSYSDVPNYGPTPDIKIALDSCMNLISYDDITLLGTLQETSKLYNSINDMQMDPDVKKIIMDWLYNAVENNYGKEQMDQFCNY